MAQPQSGWYPDPSGNPTKLRYWDGAQWTDNYMDSNQAQPSSSASASSGQAAAQPQPIYAQPVYAESQAVYPMTKDDQTMRLIAFIFCIVQCICVGVLIIPLAWTIPMTVRCYGIWKGTKPNTTAFGVCTLIFVSLVSGILLLVSEKNA